MKEDNESISNITQNFFWAAKSTNQKADDIDLIENEYISEIPQKSYWLNQYEKGNYQLKITSLFFLQF